MTRPRLTGCRACGAQGVHHCPALPVDTRSHPSMPGALPGRTEIAERESSLPWWVLVLGLITLGFAITAWLWKGPEDK